jgi:hypothetical protein
MVLSMSTGEVDGTPPSCCLSYKVSTWIWSWHFSPTFLVTLLICTIGEYLSLYLKGGNFDRLVLVGIKV